MNIDDIVKELQEIWFDKLPEKRAVTLGTGKGGVANFRKWTYENFSGEKMSDEKYQEILDGILPGYYDISTNHGEIKGPFMESEGHPNGTFAKVYWDREENGVRKGVIYSLQNWHDGHGQVERYLTKEEFESMTEGKVEMNYHNEEE